MSKIRALILFLSLSLSIFISYAEIKSDSRFYTLYQSTIKNLAADKLKELVGEKRFEASDLQEAFVQQLRKNMEESSVQMADNEMMDHWQMAQEQANLIAIDTLVAIQLNIDELKSELNLEEYNEATDSGGGAYGEPKLTREEAAPCRSIGGTKVSRLPGYNFLPGKSVPSTISISVQQVTGFNVTKEYFPLYMNGRLISRKVVYRKVKVDWSPMAMLNIYGQDDKGVIRFQGMRTTSGDSITFKANKNANLPLNGREHIFTGQMNRGYGVKLYNVNGSVTNYAEILPSGRTPVCVFVGGVSAAPEES